MGLNLSRSDIKYSWDSAGDSITSSAVDVFSYCISVVSANTCTPETHTTVFSSIATWYVVYL